MVFTMLSLIFGIILALPFSHPYESNRYLTLKSDDSNISTEDDQRFLLNNVKEIYLTGWPGVLSVYGPTAFPILAGQTGSGIYLPIAAGSRFGDGKLLGMATDDFLDPETEEGKSDKNVFILNSIRWVSKAQNPNVALINSTYKSLKPTTNFLTNHSIPTTLISAKELTSAEQLSKFDAVLVQEFFNASLVPIFREYTEKGGGLIIALTSWAHFYFMKVPGHFGAQFPANMISNQVGFIWHDDGLYDLTNRQYNASTNNLKNLKVLEAWEEIKRIVNEGYPDDTITSLQQHSTILQYGFEGIPHNDSFWSTNFYEDAVNFTQVEGQPVPSKKHPVKTDAEKFELQLFYALSTSVLKPEDVQAHPAASIFPGDVHTRGHFSHQDEEVTITFKKPSWFTDFARSSKDPWDYVPNSENTCHQGEEIADDAKPLRGAESEESEVTNNGPLWFSTGLYARPGQIIKATLKGRNMEESFDSFEIQIGSHTDDISSFPEWFRPPRITTKTNFANNTASIASPYGGLIYIVVPEKGISENEKTVSVSVRGSTRAPYFKLGKTQKRDWERRIRHEPGPWTEFESNGLILSVPSASIRELDDPEDLLLFWDQVMDAIADLAAIPRERYRQERMVPDVQISVGFMHSGYPIMTLLNEGNDAVNVSLLRTKGSWGHFHELGHNHQIPDWTFDGTVEVTCNLFALYVMNTVCGIPTEKTRVELTPKFYKAAVLRYIVGGLKFENWKQDPFLALMFYVQLQRAYGWTAYKQVFGKYRELAAHPGSEQQKIDLWLVMFSTVVQEDLSSFFKSWGFPISDNAAHAVSEYRNSGLSITDLLSQGCDKS